MNNETHDEEIKRQSKEIKKAFNKVARKISDGDIAEDIFGRFEDYKISIEYFEKGKITAVTIDKFCSTKTASFFTKNLLKGQEIYEAYESFKARVIENESIENYEDDGELKDADALNILWGFLMALIIGFGLIEMHATQLSLPLDAMKYGFINNDYFANSFLAALTATIWAILLIYFYVTCKIFAVTKKIFSYTEIKFNIPFSNWMGIIIFQLTFTNFLALFWSGLFHLLLN